MIALLGYRAEHVVELGAFGAADLVHAGLEMEKAEQAPVFDLARASAVVPGAGVLVFHGQLTVTTVVSASKGAF